MSKVSEALKKRYGTRPLPAPSFDSNDPLARMVATTFRGVARENNQPAFGGVTQTGGIQTPEQRAARANVGQPSGSASIGGQNVSLLNPEGMRAAFAGFRPGGFNPNEPPPPGVDPFAWSTRNAPIKGGDIVDRSQILAERLAQRNVGPTGTALQEALRQRAQDQFGSLSEEFNARGITPQSNAFQDMLQKNLLRESREAELEQQGRRSAAEMAFGNRFLAQNAGQLAGEQEFAEMEEAEKQARKARKRRGAGAAIGGVLGGVAGGLIGGPAGVLTGAQTGASVGSDF